LPLTLSQPLWASLRALVTVAPTRTRAQGSHSAFAREPFRSRHQISHQFVCARRQASPGASTWAAAAALTTLSAGVGAAASPVRTCRGAFPRARARRAAPVATIRPQQGRTGAGRRTRAGATEAPIVSVSRSWVRSAMLPCARARRGRIASADPCPAMAISSHLASSPHERSPASTLKRASAAMPRARNGSRSFLRPATSASRRASGRPRCQTQRPQAETHPDGYARRVLLRQASKATSLVFVRLADRNT